MVEYPITGPDTASGRTEWPVYSLFGIHLASDFRFTSRLLPAAAVPDVTFTCLQATGSARAGGNLTPIYASPYRTDGDESAFCVYRADQSDLLRFTGVADFQVEVQRITCHLLDAARDYLVEICLLGPVLSFWLERQGIPALHASSVAIGDRAVAFLSLRGNGKSTIAATMMQDGYPLLADDILPVEERHGTFVGRPSYPQMRLWPGEASYFLGGYHDLERVHPAHSKRRVPVGPQGFGSFCDSPHTLACLYVAERSSSMREGAEIEITPVSPRDAVIELVRHSFSAPIVEAAGLQPRRLNFFARMAQQVPTRRILYPSGLQHLSRIRKAILQDLSCFS